MAEDKQQQIITRDIGEHRHGMHDPSARLIVGDQQSFGVTIQRVGVPEWRMVVERHHRHVRMVLMDKVRKVSANTT